MMLFHSTLGEKQDDDNDFPGRLSWYYLVNLFLAILCAASTLAMGYVAAKVQKKLDTERVIPSMLLFLVLSLLSK